MIPGNVDANRVISVNVHSQSLTLPTKYAYAPLLEAELATSKWAWRATMLPLRQPWTIVARYEGQRRTTHPVLLERAHLTRWRSVQCTSQSDDR